MGVDIEKFVILLNDEEQCLSVIKMVLGRMHDAGRSRDTEAVTSITPELIENQERMAILDQKLLALVQETAGEIGVQPDQFKLSMIDPNGRLTGRLDTLRTLSSEIARLSSQTAGVLAADIDVIEETVRILESIDARSVSYGPVKAPVSAGSRILDRSA